MTPEVAVCRSRRSGRSGCRHRAPAARTFALFRDPGPPVEQGVGPVTDAAHRSVVVEVGRAVEPPTSDESSSRLVPLPPMIRTGMLVLDIAGDERACRRRRGDRAGFRGFPPASNRRMKYGVPSADAAGRRRTVVHPGHGGAVGGVGGVDVGDGGQETVEAIGGAGQPVAPLLEDRAPAGGAPTGIPGARPAPRRRSPSR